MEIALQLIIIGMLGYLMVALWKFRAAFDKHITPVVSDSIQRCNHCGRAVECAPCAHGFSCDNCRSVGKG